PLPAKPVMPPMPAAPAIPPVPSVMELKGGDKGSKHVFLFNRSEEEAEKTAAEWEAWAQAVEARTSEWEAVVDQRMSAWEAVYDADSEAANRELEARVEAWANEIETRVDAAYGGDFEYHIDDVSKAIESLALSCRDTALAPGETRILSSETANGETLHVACVEGDESRLHAPETLATIKHSELLCDDEKQAFTSKLASKHKIEISKN
ncbi:hypothetical protein, partial [Hyphomonas sp.]|uniref:hypothetical protein n=1 Tax=Hyphomonas sp. TaxID=87 RepID=UPI0030F9F789